jgi:hypothetical protein
VPALVDALRQRQGSRPLHVTYLEQCWGVRRSSRRDLQ